MAKSRNRKGHAQKSKHRSLMNKKVNVTIPLGPSGNNKEAPNIEYLEFSLRLLKEQTIPVESEDSGDTQQLELLSKKIMTLDNIINSAKRNIATTEQILKKQH
jgi:hypothetical protein